MPGDPLLERFNCANNPAAERFAATFYVFYSVNLESICPMRIESVLKVSCNINKFESRLSALLWRGNNSQLNRVPEGLNALSRVSRGALFRFTTQGIGNATAQRELGELTFTNASQMLPQNAAPHLEWKQELITCKAQCCLQSVQDTHMLRNVHNLELNWYCR